MVGKLSSADLSTMDTLVDLVEPDQLFSCDTATESIAMSDFCTKVPKAVLVLADMTESLWEYTNEGWLNPVIALRGQLDKSGFAERLPVRGLVQQGRKAFSLPQAGDQPPPESLDDRAGSRSREGAVYFTEIQRLT